MESTDNPYMPPAHDAPKPPPLLPAPPDEASTGQRFVTYLIDRVAVYGLIVAARTLHLQNLGREMDRLDSLFNGWLFGAPIVLLYFIAFEAATGRTAGKLVAGTKVVSATGGTPSFGQITGRSLVRLIPFEPFSFIFANRGWHDRWSGTRVVRLRR